MTGYEVALGKMVNLDCVPDRYRGHGCHMTRAGSDAGATAVEYALMVMLISMAIIGSVLLFGQAVTGMLVMIPCPPFTRCSP